MLMELEGATQVIWELVYLSHTKLCTQLVFLYNEYFLSLVGPWLHIFFPNPSKIFHIKLWCQHSIISIRAWGLDLPFWSNPKVCGVIYMVRKKLWIFFFCFIYFSLSYIYLRDGEWVFKDLYISRLILSPFIPIFDIMDYFSHLLMIFLV